MSTALETPKTDSLISAIKFLPGIGESQIPSMVAKVRRAEMALALAQQSMERALRDLADDLTSEDDGWTFDEIWNTPLRSESVIIKQLQSNK